MARKVVFALLLVSQALAASGAPLPMPAPSKDRSSPFPCMHRACGCMSAEQCWRSCCCFTNEQKIAWAARNGVAVPEHVRERSPAKKKACAACAKPGGCTHSKDCSHCAKETPSQTPKNETHWVLGMMALQCQGHRPLGLLVDTPAVPSSDAFTWTNFVLHLDCVPFTHATPTRLAHIPLDPPPRHLPS